LFKAGLVGAALLAALPASAQAPELGAPQLAEDASDFGNMDQPITLVDDDFLVFHDEPADPAPSVTIQNGQIGSAETTPVTYAPDAIVTAIESGDLGTVYRILRAECSAGCGARLDAADALHAAATTGNIGILDILIAEGGNLNDRAEASGWTPLIAALYVVNIDMARYLVEAGADTTIMGEDGTSAPFLASLAGLGDLIPYPKLELTQADADLLLLRAVEAGSVQYVELALASGAGAGATAENGWSALMIASFRGQTEVAQRLIAHDNSIVGYAEPESGLHAAHVALIGLTNPSDHERLESLLRSLAEAGLDMNRTTAEGISALGIVRNQDYGPPIEQLVSDLASGIALTIAPPEPVLAVTQTPTNEPPYLRAGYLIENLRLRDGPSTDFPIVETMLRGDRVEVLEGLGDDWVRIMASTGSFGYIRERFVSDASVDPAQYGAVCIDSARPFSFFFDVNGQPDAESATGELFARSGGEQACGRVRNFSGEECFAMAFTGNDLSSSQDFYHLVGRNRTIAEADAASGCRMNSNNGVQCRGLITVCAAPDRN